MAQILIDFIISSGTLRLRNNMNTCDVKFIFISFSDYMLEQQWNNPFKYILTLILANYF